MPDAAAPSVLDRLVAADSPVRIGFASVCQELFDHRFTGSVVVHFRNGLPQELEFPQPLKVKLALPGSR